MINWVDFVDVMHVKIMNGMLPANYWLDLWVRISLLADIPYCKLFHHWANFISLINVLHPYSCNTS